MISTRQLPRILWRWSWIWAAIHCPGALAAVAEVESQAIFSTAYLVQVVGSLLLVFGCLFGVVFLLKKLNGVPVSDRKAIRVLSSVKVGSRERIMLVETGDNQLLVGVAAGSVRTLHVFERALDESVNDGDFNSVLRSAAGPEGTR